MASVASLTALTLAGIAHRCSQETERFFRRLEHDPRYCFELFRRAVTERSQAAYELLYRQYQALVFSWIERHPSMAGLDEETQYFVNRTFEKMWRALTPAKFERFPDLKSLLSYLKLCAHSVVVDYARAGQPKVVDEELAELQLANTAADTDLEADTVAQMEQQEFWRLISERLNDDKERIVLYGAFVLALKPRDLLSRYPGTFVDVTEIYRTKQNLLERLRRDKELHQLLAPAA